jgi:hypothetical protein
MFSVLYRRLLKLYDAGNYSISISTFDTIYLWILKSIKVFDKFVYQILESKKSYFKFYHRILTVALTSKYLSLGSSDNYTTVTFVSTPPAPNIPIVESKISFATDDFQNLKLQNSTISNSKAATGESYHNFDLEAILITEADCEDIDADKKVSHNMLDLYKLITSLSQQISNQTTFIQDQLKNQNSFLQDQTVVNDLKIQRIIQDNEDFKRDVKQELENLKQCLMQPNVTSTFKMTPPSQSHVSSSPQSQGRPHSVMSNNLSHDSSANVLPDVNVTASLDTQNQVMMMLAESFSKLSTLMVQDKSTNDLKYEWPKFLGDTKSFKAWYLAILAHLSLPHWKDLYDASKKDFVKTTSNTLLNGNYIQN